jgi:hypothetical protein
MQPARPVADLADSPDISVPLVDFDATVTHVLSTNTEARAARNGPMRARLALRLAEVTPIPDVFVYGTYQRDFTNPALGRTTYNTQVGIPVPIFDRNKGNILTARGTLIRATQEIPRVENDLRMRLADAFERGKQAGLALGPKTLPDDEREVLLLFAWEELPYQSMAEGLELPIGTVRSRLNRARAHLRELLEAKGKNRVRSR